MPEEQWGTPTDLAGWDVRAVASHTAHLEGILAGAPEETADVGEPAHVTGFMGLYTEIGVVNRREASPDAIINEIRAAATTRHTALLERPAHGRARRCRRRSSAACRGTGAPCSATGRSTSGCTSRTSAVPSAARAAWTRRRRRHTAEYLAESLGFVLGKKVGAPAGTTLVLEMEGSAPFAFAINDAGRGERLPEPPDDPTVTLRMDRESFIRLAGGRCDAEPGAVTVEGDQRPRDAVVASLATTP